MSTINLDTVFTLPVRERIRLVEAIWDSVANDAAEIDLQPWHAAELDRRISDFERDPAEGVPWTEVKHRILHAG